MKKVFAIKSMKSAILWRGLILSSQFGMALILSMQVWAAERSANPASSVVTEAAFECACDCAQQSGTPLVRNKKDLANILKVINTASVPSYFWKYHIDQFMEEVVRKSPQSKAAVEKSINTIFSSLPVQDQVIVSGVSFDNKSTQISTDIVVSRFLTLVSKKVPEVREIADRYVVKVQLNGSANDTGLIMGQQKTITFETNSKKTHSKSYMGFSYSFCDDNSTVFNVGTKSVCSISSDKVAGKIEGRVYKGLYLGGSLTDNFRKSTAVPDGQLYFRFEY